MSLRIACDLDGVLADLEGAIAEASVRLFGPVEQAGTAAQGSTAREEDDQHPPPSRRGRGSSLLGLSDFRPSPRTASPAAANDIGRPPSEPGQSIRAVPAGPPRRTADGFFATGQASPTAVPTVADSGGTTSGAGGRDRTQAAIDDELAAVEAALVEALKRPMPRVSAAVDEETGGAAGENPLLRDSGDRSSDESEASERAGGAPADGGTAAQPGEPAESTGAAEAFGDSAIPAGRSLSDSQQTRLWRELRARPNFWETLDEIEPGAVARLAVLAERLRWEVIFITQRPSTAGDTCQVQTQRWLERHGFARPSVFVIRGSRGRVAAALDLDVVIDDRPENSLDVIVDSKARSVLIWRGEAASPIVQNARRMGIRVYASMMECLDALADPAWGRPTLMGRIKGFLGRSAES
ncbi:MAG: hypothetical protein ACE148_17190 [Vicinamibacterales bacterium]